MLTLPEGTKIEPIEDNLFCRIYRERENQAAIPGGNIIKPGTAIEEVFLASVVSAGPGKAVEVDSEGAIVARKPMTIEIGDDIVFRRYRGERITIGRDVFIVLSQDDVLTKITIPEKGKKELFRWAGESDNLAGLGSNEQTQ